MKTKSNKKFIGIALMVSMVALYGVLPSKNASAINSIRDAKDRISDSSLSATGVLHTITFLTTSIIPAGGTIQVEFPSGINSINANADVNCDTGGVASGAGTRIAVCTYALGLIASTSRTITVANMVNPATDGSQRIDVRTYSGTNILDRVGVMVYIIHDVWMTATVDPILIFTLNGVNANSKSVNSINCSATTTATSTPFGTLVVNATTTVCQRLNVTTNADDGYVVTVEQDQELTSDSGSNINSFDNSPNGFGSTSPHTWVAPTNTLDQYHTYGHMGLTSDDQNLGTFGYNNYYNGGGTAQYVGLNNTAPVVIMHHDGPSDGLAQNIGETFVAYSAQIASLQEAGDYESTLTYIATPTY